MAFKRAAATLIVCLLAQTVFAQTTSTVLSTQPSWNQLNATQRSALTPLAKEWNTFPDDRKVKWLNIANRYASMTPVEQARLQERMKDWTALSPLEREQARIQYKTLRTAPAHERQAMEQRWQEYDALPKEEKQRLKTTRPAVTPPISNASAPVTASQQRPPKAVLIAPERGKPTVSSR